MRRALALMALFSVTACPAADGGGTGGGTVGAGGGEAAGGGSSGGSAGGGSSSSGGGTSGAGGGTASAGGAFFQLDVGTEYPSVAVGADGVLRVAYATAFGGTLRYAECRQGCESSGGWSFVTVDTVSGGSVGHARLGIGPDNRAHVVYETTDSQASDRTHYATCTSSCGNAGSWSKLELSSLLGSTRAAFRGSPLVVDSQGRVSFVTSIFSTGGDIRLTSCGSGCTSLASWQSGVIRNGGGRNAMAANGTTLHMIINDEASRLHYRTCASACTQAASWQESSYLFVHDGTMPVAMAVSPQGRLYLAYNQGYTDASEPQAVRDQAYKMLVWQCDSSCMMPASWSGVVLGAMRDGEDGVSLAEHGGALVLALTQSLTLTASVCTGSCTTATSWQTVELDSSSAMAASVDPYAAFNCSGSRPLFAAWYPDDGVVALTPTGEALFAHAAYGLRTCSSTQARQPASLRLIYVP